MRGWSRTARRPTREESPGVKGWNIPRTGKPSRALLLVTKTLLIAGEGYGGAPMLRAHDKATGEIIAEIPLPGGRERQADDRSWRAASNTSCSQSAGRRELVALALP